MNVRRGQIQDDGAGRKDTPAHPDRSGSHSVCPELHDRDTRVKMHCPCLEATASWGRWIMSQWEKGGKGQGRGQMRGSQGTLSMCTGLVPLPLSTAFPKLST